MNSNEPSPVEHQNRQQGTTKAETRKADKAKAAEIALNAEIETACWSIAYSRISPCLPLHFVKKKSANWTHALVLRYYDRYLTSLSEVEKEDLKIATMKRLKNEEKFTFARAASILGSNETSVRRMYQAYLAAGGIHHYKTIMSLLQFFMYDRKSVVI